MSKNKTNRKKSQKIQSSGSKTNKVAPTVSHPENSTSNTQKPSGIVSAQSKDEHPSPDNTATASAPNSRKRRRCSTIRFYVEIFVGLFTVALTGVIARANWNSSEQTKRANDIQELLVRLTQYPHFVMEAEGNDFPKNSANAQPHSVKIINKGTVAEQIHVHGFRTLLEVNCECAPTSLDNLKPMYIDLTSHIYKAPNTTKNPVGIVYQTEPISSQQQILEEVFQTLNRMPIICNVRMLDFASLSYYNPGNGEYKQQVIGNIGETEPKTYQEIVEDSRKYDTFLNRREDNGSLVESIMAYCAHTISNKIGLLQHRRILREEINKQQLVDPPAILDVETPNLTSTNYLQDVFYLLGCHYRLAAINIGESNPKNSARKLIYLFYALNCFNQSPAEESQWGMDATFCQILIEAEEGYLESYFTLPIHPFTEDAIRILEEIANNSRNRDVLRKAAQEFLDVAKRAKEKPPKPLTLPINKE